MRGGGDRVIEIRTERIRPFATQPREYFDEAALRDLERSIKAVGQQVEIIVLPLSGGSHDYELVDGQRRWLACAKLGIKIRACVREGMGDAEDQFLTSIVANFARAEHTPAEIAKSIARLRKRPEVAALSGSVEQVQAIANIFGRSAPWVYSYENLLKLAPEVLVLTEPSTPQKKRITLQAAALLSALPVQMQRTLANRAAKMTARGLERVIRGKAKDSGIKLRSHKPYMQRKRGEASLNAIAGAAESLAEIAGDFRAVFAARPRSERESFVYRIDNVIDELSKVRRLAAGVLGIRERRWAA